MPRRIDPYKKKLQCLGDPKPKENGGIDPTTILPCKGEMTRDKPFSMSRGILIYCCPTCETEWHYDIHKKQWYLILRKDYDFELNPEKQPKRPIKKG